MNPSAMNASEETGEEREHEGAGSHGHSVVLEFDGGVFSAQLVHPEIGCVPAFDRAEGDDEKCWLTSWFDNLTPEELLAGKVEAPICAEWHSDHPEVYLEPDASELTALRDEVTRLRAALTEITGVVPAVRSGDAGTMRKIATAALSTPSTQEQSDDE